MERARKRAALAAALAAAAAVTVARVGHAQTTGNWTNNKGGSWGIASNWQGGIPNGDAATANFTISVPAGTAVTLDGNRTVGALNFGTSSWNINAGTGGNLILSNGGSMATLGVGAGGNVTFNVPITAAAGAATPTALDITGPGTTNFSGPLTFAGDITIDSGTTVFNSYTGGPTVFGTVINGLMLTQDAAKTGPGVNSLTISDGATVTMNSTLFLQGNGSGNPTLVGGNGTLQLRNANSSFANPDLMYGLQPNNNDENAVLITSNVDVGTGNRWITGNSNHNEFSVHNGDLDLRGNLIGSATINVSGKPYNGDPYSLIFRGDDSAWTGALRMVEGSFVPYNSGDTVTAIGAKNAVIFAPGAGQDAGIYLYGQNVTIGSLSGSGAGNMWIRNAEWTTDTSGDHTTHLSTATLTVNQTADGTYPGQLADGPSDRAPGNAIYLPLAVVKAGSATLTLTGNNTYSGGTTINAGTLEIAGTGTNPLGSGAIAVNSGGTLKLTQSRIFGSGTSVPSQSIAINGGTLTNNNSFNALGNVTLTGGTIAGTPGLTPGQFEAFALNGTVSTTASSTASTLTSSGAGAGFHLASNTTFDVAQGTTSNGQDLIVSGTLLDQSFDQTGNRAGGLTKTGAGTMVLAGANTYTGPTVVNAGKLLVTGSIASPAALTVNAGTLALGGLSPSIQSKTIRIGSGATFDASSVPFTVASGQTLIAGHTSGSGPDVLGNITVGQGGILDAGGVSVPATLALANNLTLNSGTVRLDLGASSSTGDLVAVGGNLALSGTNSILLNSASGSLAAGQYNLFTYAGTLTGGASNLSVAGVPSGTTRQTIGFDASAGAVKLIIAGSAANLIWTGVAAANEWHVKSPADWSNGGAPDTFFNLDSVTFDDSGSANSNVSIVDTVSPTSLTVNSSHDYTLGGPGSIAGSTGLTKSGTGTLTMTTSNTFVGPVTINGGVLSTPSLANGGAASPLGAGNSIAMNGGTLRYTGSSDSSDRAVALGASGGTLDVSAAAGSLSLTGAVGGSGNLTKLGSGTLGLGSSNTYTGTTSVKGGTLAVASDASLGAVPAAANAAALTLSGGNLQFTGSANLNANRGITISAPASIDTQSNSVTIAGNIAGAAASLTKLGSGTLALTGTNTFNGATIVGGGVLQVPGDAGLGAPASLTLQNGGTVAFTAAASLDPGRNIILGPGGGGINSGGNSIVIPGAISGGPTGTFALTGGGNFELAGPNSYSTPTVVDVNVKNLQIDSGAALGSGSLTLQGIANFELRAGGDTVPNDINLPANASGFSHWETPMGTMPVLAGKISGGSAGYQIEFNLNDSNGPGGITLANPNNNFLAGKLDLNRGMIGVAATGALGNPGNLLYLDVTKSGIDQPNTGLQFLAPNVKIANPVQFNDYTNIGVNGNNGEEISGNITGPGGSRSQDYFILGGTQDNNGNSVGSLRLSGNNTFTQNLTVTPDTMLTAGSPSALGTGNNITLQSGASLAFDSAGVNTNQQNVNVNGDGVIAGGAGRGAILNLNGSNTFGGTVTLQSDATIGVAKAADTLTLAGPLATGTNALSKIGPGTLALASPDPAGVNISTLNIKGGAVAIGSTTGAAGPLTITTAVTVNDGATLKLPSAGPHFTSAISGLKINGSGTLDVGTSAVSFDKATTPSDTILQYLNNGYSASKTAPSITTSAADSAHTVGYADGADGVVSGLAPANFLVKYTLNGDVNLDGKVNFSDLVGLAAHYGLQSGAKWDQGDSNHDGKVNFTDLVDLAANYGKSLSAAQLSQFSPAFQADVQQAFAAVPEPGTLAIFGVAAIGLLPRRHRSRS